MAGERYLITTADERSWKFDRPVLFLGEWCRLYNRKQAWSQMEAEIANPFGLDKKIENTRKLKNELLLELTEKLNEIHGTHLSSRYWNIVIGPWLHRYVDIFFNRYHTIKNVFDHYSISSTTVFASSYSLATSDSLTFIYACNDDVWNHVLYGKIIDFLKPQGFSPEIAYVKTTDSYSQPTEEILQKPLNFKSFVISTVSKALTFFKCNKDALIINSYLPKKEELKLQMLLGQCPQLWTTPALIKIKSDLKMRQKLVLNTKNKTGFELFIRQELTNVIPVCYLEGYQSLNQQAESLNWPTHPKFIFTSNLFDTDEIFKHWAGLKAEAGFPYFIGQHGNNYGTLVGNEYLPELVTPERFFTWGWKNKNPKNVPALNFKIIGAKSSPYNKNGGLLLIELHVAQRLTPWDDYYEFGLYQQEQFDFVKTLQTSIHEQLTVRLHSQYRNYAWFEELRWASNSPKTKLEKGKIHISDLIANSRLVVHSYDSTGILETLALNIPTLCFWQNGFDHLIPEAKPYYQLLKEVGIIADGPKEAADFINKNWDSLEEWWTSDVVQNARRTFCDIYSKTDKHPLLKMKELLNACAENRL